MTLYHLQLIYYAGLNFLILLQRPPYSIELFTSEQVKRITEYIIYTYFRHLKMYRYVFTTLVSYTCCVLFLYDRNKGQEFVNF